jgi:RNA polymerase sigma-70 factor (ECF subfamily)
MGSETMLRWISRRRRQAVSSCCGSLVSPRRGDCASRKFILTADASNEHSDGLLAAAAARGDRDALQALLHRHADRIHRICRRVLGNTDDALDATQEAMIAIARGIDRFDGRSAFTTWMYRVTTNAALDEARRRSRRPLPADELPERESTAPDFATNVDTRISIELALTQLPEEFRAAVVLRDECDLDYAAIAQILGIPPGTVRSRIARGRAALASILGNSGDLEERPTER